MRGIARNLLLGMILAVGSPCASDAAGVVIAGARVIDGSGGPSRQADVRIEGERIVAVGTIEPQPGDQKVDAAGLVLAPGFIDVHSHHDEGLLAMPDALAAVNQGITTVVVGQDGEHPYPLEQFFRRLDASPVAINVASLAGHGSLRSQVMGDDYRRPATAREVAAMADLLRTEMAAGAMGLSSGLEYDPGSYASTEEVVELARVAAAYGGRYISHIRSEDQYFWEAVDEIIRIGREAGLPVQVTHMKLAMTRWWGQADRLQAKLDAARESGVEITADVYPYTAWNTSFGWLGTVFPGRDLGRREGAEYILREMLSPEGILLPDYRPEPAYSGMTIAQIAAARGADPESTLMELLQADAAAGSESSMIGFAMDEADIEKLMAWPHTVIGSDGELAGPHPRGYGAFTRFLGHYVRERGVLSLEEGIHRISLQAAQQVGIADRGSISAGSFADLVLFDPDTVADRASYERPHSPSVGIEKVWVNGALVFDAGRPTGKRPGNALRRPTVSRD